MSLGTDPNNADSDGDRFSDGSEVAAGTDPLDQNELPEGESLSVPGLVSDTTDDSDGDGLSDAEELYLLNLDPAKPDSDGDGILDGQELILGLDPKNPFG